MILNYPLFYIHSNNFGDALNPFLYKYITGRDCTIPKDDSPKILACGSVAHEAKPYDIVWGTGCISKDVPVKTDVTTRILATRGPLTAELLGYDPEVYGDPGLLISRYIKPSEEKTKKIGVVPHYIDRDIVLGDPSLSMHYIDIMSGIDNVIKCVTTCDFIISSALHGLICAEAYGIPAIWVEFSDKVAGNGFKFRDYYLGTGRQPPEPVDLRTNRNVSGIYSALDKWTPPVFDEKLLVSVCPFNWGASDYKRWRVVKEMWVERNKNIALLIDGKSVIEFGAGNEALGKLLSCSYTPSDIYKRSPQTVVCDLNTPIYPDLSSYDTIVMSGVLEYIYDDNIKRFLEYTKRFPNIETFVLSYSSTVGMKGANGWVNDYSEESLKDVLGHGGFSMSVNWNGIYKFIRPATTP